ncbi:hypothetical protein G9A89_003574 [Geosiphon pyriformis]|nr:hypothetical protein G9A89_003574 [Geosiphon pyriformis]
MPSEKKKHFISPPPGLDFVTPPHDSLVDDLRYALEHARELFPDIAWEFTLALTPTIVYAHKSILYARSSRTFQENFLKIKDANGMSVRSMRMSNPEPIIVKTEANPFSLRQELKFFYTGEEGSEEFLAAVDTTAELEQDKLKEDLLYMLKSKLYTDVELLLSISEDSLDIFPEEDFTPTSHRAHRFMLASRSEYFKAMLNSQFIEARLSTIHLDASIFTPTSLNLILTFVYTGNLSSSSKPLTLETCEMVWIGADFLGIKSLCDECVHRIATKVHSFSCTCAECQAVIPRVAGFAKEHHVDMLWQGSLHVLSQGFDSMWPQKAFAELEENIREEVLLNLLAKIQNSNIVETFRGCRKILAIIEVKGIGLPWIEIIRGMANHVRSYTAGILVDDFQQLCEEDKEFLNCVDGVGFSSDLLEDIMKIVVEEGLTEQNAGTVLNCITGNLLLREAVLDAESVETKRILLQAKQNVSDYIKKRWIGVKQHGGFSELKDWLLDEFAQDLGITKAELTETVSEPKPKSRTPVTTNGIRTNGKTTSPSTSPKGRTTPSTKSSLSLGSSSTVTKTISTFTTISTTNSTGSSSPKTIRRSATTSVASSTGSSKASDLSAAKKSKSVRIVTTPATFGRPTRASVLRQKALAEAAAKNPVKQRTKTMPERISNSSTNSVSSLPPVAGLSKSKSASALNSRVTRPDSKSSLNVPGVSTPPARGRISTKQTASAASSRASSISSIRSSKSPSISPSRFGGVRQTRASILRQLKFDETEQRRGRDRQRKASSPTSSRASSIASVSSVASSTNSSNVVHPKRSGSQYSTSTSMTTASTGSISSLPAKPHQTKLSTTKDPDISVGRRVILPTKNNSPGTIQFLGETEFARGHWVGIALDNPVGKNNGTVANIQYFETSPNQGIFVRPDSILII